ncbi:MAG: drug/metabolite transporter (DMT)-like permease [Mariniblastus sp.]
MSDPISEPASSHVHSNRIADINLLLVAAIWGVNIAIMKLALNEIDLFRFNSIRLTLSAVVLGIFVWVENKKRNDSALAKKAALDEAAPPRVRKWLTIAAFAIMAGGVYQILFAVGMNRTTAGNTALIMSSMPMWTAVLSFVLLREKLGLAWVGLTITFLGTLVVTLQKGGFQFDSESLAGNGLVLLAALAWAMGAVVSRPMLKFVSPIRLAFFSTAGTLPIHYAMPYIMNSPDVAEVWTPKIVACILYSGIFSTGLAYAMWNFGVQQLGPSHAAVYQNLVPLIACIAAWIFLREQISAMQIIGGSLIIFGLYITRRLRPKPMKLPRGKPAQFASDSVGQVVNSQRIP